MLAKVNAKIFHKANQTQKVNVELWDVDVLSDDRIDALEIELDPAKSKVGIPIEFVFSTSKTGEFNPELQLRVVDSNTGTELYRTETDKSISLLNIDDATGLREVSTVEFGDINLK